MFIHLCVHCSGHFHRYDHGDSENMQLYHTLMPPMYNLSNIQTRLHLMFGSNDNLVSPEVCASPFFPNILYQLIVVLFFIRFCFVY